MLALRILAVIAGAALVVAAIGSSVKTVVLPRATASRITRSVFLLLRLVFRVVANRFIPGRAHADEIHAQAASRERVPAAAE